MEHEVVSVTLLAASSPLLQQLHGGGCPLSFAQAFHSVPWFVSILRGRKNQMRWRETENQVVSERQSPRKEYTQPSVKSSKLSLLMPTTPQKDGSELHLLDFQSLLKVQMGKQSKSNWNSTKSLLLNFPTCKRYHLGENLLLISLITHGTGTYVGEEGKKMKRILESEPDRRQFLPLFF